MEAVSGGKLCAVFAVFSAVCFGLAPDLLAQQEGSGRSLRGLIDRLRGDKAAAPSLADQAIAQIPFERLAPEARRKVGGVLDGYAFHRRTDVQVFRADPALYCYMIERPEATAALWRAVGIANAGVWRAGDGRFSVDDGQGTTGVGEILYQDHELHVLYAHGAYDGPVFPALVRAGLLIIVRSGFFRDTDGHVYVSHRADIFVKPDSEATRVLTRGLRTVAAGLAEERMSEALELVALMARYLTMNEQHALRLVNQAPGLSAEVRAELRQIVGPRLAAGGGAGTVASPEVARQPSGGVVPR